MKALIAIAAVLGGLAAAALLWPLVRDRIEWRRTRREAEAHRRAYDDRGWV